MEQYHMCSLIAAFFLSLHLFSIKLLTIYDSYFYEILAFTIIALLISRYLIYISMKSTKNPTNVHLMLTTSVFFTFIFTLLFLKIQDFDIKKYSIGLLFIFIGIVCIQTSYST